MAERIIMPKQGLQMTEGTIIKWLVAEGDRIEAGMPIFELETDKLTIVVDAMVCGILLKIVAAEGDTVPITETVAIVGDPGENIDSLLPEAGASNLAPCGNGRPAAPLITPRARMRAAELELDYTTITGTAPDGLICERDILSAKQSTPAASPLARRVANDRDIVLDTVQGTGPRGKIMRRDVVAVEELDMKETISVPLRGMRGTIARRMKQSVAENAQATHRIRVRMDEAARLRGVMKEAGSHVTYNDIIAFATVRALLDFPEVNAEIVGDTIVRKRFVNLGVAVAVEDGLLVPVVKGAERFDLPALSAAIRELCGHAVAGSLNHEDCGCGSFTVSNLGMYGLEEFTAIINPPEAGILAVGQIADMPVAVDGRVEIHPLLRLTLSYDHRVVDGAPAARFLARLRDYLETPYRML